MTMQDYKDRAKSWAGDDFEDFYRFYQHMMPAGVMFVDLEKEFLAVRAITRTFNPVTTKIPNVPGATYVPKYKVGTELKHINGEKRTVYEVFGDGTYNLRNGNGVVNLPEYVIDRDWEVQPLSTTFTKMKYNLGDILEDFHSRHYVIDKVKTLSNNGQITTEYTLVAPLAYGGYSYHICTEDELDKNYRHVSINSPAVKSTQTKTTKDFKKMILDELAKIKGQPINPNDPVVDAIVDATTITLAGHEFIMGKAFDDLFPNTTNSVTKRCDHVFVDYLGLVESFRYCKKCDVREDEVQTK